MHATVPSLPYYTTFWEASILSGQPLLSSQLADIPEDDRLIEVQLAVSIYLCSRPVQV